MVCPICISLALLEVPRELSITTSYRGRSREAREMRAFVCTQGHVFLCRSCDIRAHLGDEDRGDTLPEKKIGRVGPLPQNLIPKAAA